MTVNVLPSKVKIPKDHIDLNQLRLERMRRRYITNLGNSVLYTHVEGRTKRVELWDVVGVYSRFIHLKREAYHPDGSFRQWMHTCVSIPTLFCREESAELLPMNL